MWNDSIIEPSYEMHSKQEIQYFDNMKTLIETVPDVLLHEEKIAETQKKFIHFIEMSKKINNGEFLICDQTFYDEQADYCQIL